MAKLKGVVLRPWPEVPGSEWQYSELKPHEVNYVFESGAVRVICYDVNRQVVSDRMVAPGVLLFDSSEILSVREWKERLHLAVLR